MWVLFPPKGSQVTLTTTGCLLIGPETVKRHGQRRREKAKRDKKGGKILFSPDFIFFFSSLCVFKTGLMAASGLAGSPSEVRMSVCVSLSVRWLVYICNCLTLMTAFFLHMGQHFIMFCTNTENQRINRLSCPQATLWNILMQFKWKEWLVI